MSDLHAKFLPQFVEAAEQRLARAIDSTAKRNYTSASTTVRELHGLAGEAGLLGLAAVVPLARRGEDLAKKMASSRQDADAAALGTVLEELRDAIRDAAKTLLSPA